MAAGEKKKEKGKKGKKRQEPCTSVIRIRSGRILEVVFGQPSQLATGLVNPESKERKNINKERKWEGLKRV